MQSQLDRSHSFHHATVNEQDLPALRHADEKQSQRQLAVIQEGGNLKESNEMLPDSRPCRDVIWAIFFIAAFAFVALPAFMPHEHHTPHLTGSDVRGGVLGVVAAVFVAIACLHYMHSHAEQVVYISLYFSPILMIIAGAAMLATGHCGKAPHSRHSGGIPPCFTLMIFGVLYITVVKCCYQKYIPFMVDILRIVSEVIIQNPRMLLVAAALAVFNFAFPVLCYVSYRAGGYSHAQSGDEGRPGEHNNNGWAAACFFVFVWGTYVIYNVCHVTYCGIFARSYFSRPMSEGPVCQSLKVAFTSSFGSVCLGSLLVTLIRMVQMLAKAAKNEGKKEKNAVMCILGCIAECFIKCIGDMMEYFNDWAYVQCAVRGVGFIDSVRITFSMLTCAHLQFVIRDLLLGTVVSAGSLLCAIVGAACAFAVRRELHEPGFDDTLVGYDPGASRSVMYGCLGGFVAGSTAFGVMSSGVKTILVCWVDNPNPLKLKHEDMDRNFATRINSGYDNHMGLLQGQ